MIGYEEMKNQIPVSDLMVWSEDQFKTAIKEYQKYIREFRNFLLQQADIDDPLYSAYRHAISMHRLMREVFKYRFSK